MSDPQKLKSDATEVRRVVRHGILTCERVVLHTPGKLPNVPAVKVKLPPADPKVAAKVRTHLVCVGIGGLAAILLTWVDPLSGIGHLLPLLPATPSAFMEALDRINDR